MNHSVALVSLVTAGALVACGGRENRLGGTNAPGGGGATGGSPSAIGSEAGEATDSGELGTGGMAVPQHLPQPQKPNFPAEFGDPSAPHAFAAGKWKGYIENLPSTRSDAILLELDALSETGMVGKFVFGDASAEVPDFSDPDAVFTDLHGDALDDPPNEGYPFTVVFGSFDGLRLRFEVIRMEVWQSWCIRQAPIENAGQPGSYLCGPNGGGFSAGQGCSPVSCGRHRVECVVQQHPEAFFVQQVFGLGSVRGAQLEMVGDVLAPPGS